MPDDVRIYGDFKGISEEDFRRIKPDIPFPQVAWRDDILSVDHEGQYLDVDDFLKLMIKLVPADGWGKLDFIDHVDWKLTRYEIRDGAMTVKEVNVDAVLESTKNEAGRG